MHERPTAAADQTAVRVALWRALHVQIDPPPHVLEDEIGLRLADPDDGWRRRPDMDAQGTRPFRASIVARARFIEDLLAEEVAGGVDQYVLLGAGLDTFAQRRPELASRLRMFEVDRPGPQEWKRNASSNSASAFRIGCASCLSTSRRAHPGASDCRPKASSRTSPRSWLPPA